MPTVCEQGGKLGTPDQAMFLLLLPRECQTDTLSFAYTLYSTNSEAGHQFSSIADPGSDMGYAKPQAPIQLGWLPCCERGRAETTTVSSTQRLRPKTVADPTSCNPWNPVALVALPPHHSLRSAASQSSGSSSSSSSQSISSAANSGRGFRPR